MKLKGSVHSAFGVAKVCVAVGGGGGEWKATLRHSKGLSKRQEAKKALEGGEDWER